MKKGQLYLLGLITLVLFPIPTFFGLWYFEDIYWYSIFQFDTLTLSTVIYGTAIGVGYAFIALYVMRAPIFDTLPVRIETIVQNMNLSVIDCIFLSLCAGIGEELLFRSGVQFYLGPIITSIIFVAIHGYLNPWNWKMSLYGIIVLPFIFLISYGFESLGLWFAIVAHATYDLVLFLSITRSKTSIE